MVEVSDCVDLTRFSSVLALSLASETRFGTCQVHGVNQRLHGVAMRFVTWFVSYSDLFRTQRHLKGL